MPTCLCCEKKFYERPSRIAQGKGKYCSLVCRKKGKSSPIIICKMCGKEFQVCLSRYKEGARKYCSNQCYSKAKKAPWWSHPEYMLLAKEMLHKAIREGRIIKQVCLVCHSGESEAHHQDYLEPLEVMWFCKSHHQLWHEMLNDGAPWERDGSDRDEKGGE